MPTTTLANPITIMNDFSDISFVESKEFYWSAKENTVHYNSSEFKSIRGTYRLIHEIGHALCNHKNYVSGVGLLALETEAWSKASEIAKKYGLVIDTDYIESCLDSYRDWLHRRSSCPDCTSISVESGENEYKCFNCLKKWAVSGNQRSRCYRQTLA